MYAREKTKEIPEAHSEHSSWAHPIVPSMSGAAHEVVLSRCCCPAEYDATLRPRLMNWSPSEASPEFATETEGKGGPVGGVVLGRMASGCERTSGESGGAREDTAT